MTVSRPDPRSATPLARVTFCVLDLETTGTDPGWDEITEVGAILVRGGERLGTFHTLVGPGHAGIDGVLPSLVDFIGDAVITGHNISFDIRFLDAALARAERPLLDSSDVVDTMYLARALLRDDADDCRLGTLAARFEFEHRPSHRAFEDAAATVDLLHLLIERSSAFGVVGLDDLCALPTLAGHKWAAKLRHTASLPREPGVFTCLDDRGQVVWVGEAGDLRRDVRQLFSRAGSAVHASVLRDTCGWEVRHVASPLARAVARQRLLHAHRPRLQRRDVMGDAAVFVQVASTSRSVKAAVVRSATTTGYHLGPISDRATAAAAVACIRRLAGAGAGADMIAMLADAADGRPEPLERALVELASTTPDDPVDAALDLQLRDRPRNHQLHDPNTLVGQSVVQHLAVRALGGKRHRRASEAGSGLHRRAAVDQHDRAVAGGAHRRQHRANRRDQAERREAQRLQRDLGGEVEHRLQIRAGRQWAVLQGGDRAEVGCGSNQGRAQ